MTEGIKIRELEESLSIKNTDVLLIDTISDVDMTTTQTKKITYENVISQLEGDLDIESNGSSNKVSVGDYIGLNYGTDPIVVQVTIGPKTINNRYASMPDGSNIAFYIDGKEAPYLLLTPGRTYQFSQGDPTNLGHQLRFYDAQTKRFFPISDGVTYSDNPPGTIGAFTQIKIPDTYVRIYYESSTSGYSYMGNGIFNADGDDSFVNPFPMIEALQSHAQSVDTSITNFSSSIETLNTIVSEINTKLSALGIFDDLTIDTIQDNYQSVVQSIATLRSELEAADKELNERIDDLGTTIETE